MTEAEFLEDYELARRLHGALWAAGDYTRVAEQLTGVSAAVVNAAGIVPGLRVLDLGAGSGNTALSAAGLGAKGARGGPGGCLFRARPAARRRGRGDRGVGGGEPGGPAIPRQPLRPGPVRRGRLPRAGAQPAAGGGGGG